MAQQFAFFPLVPLGKTPAIEGWRTVSAGIYPASGNYGIALTAQFLVIDADPRNYPPGRDILSELIQSHQLPPTRTVKTPRGGYHLYFTKPEELKFRQKQPKYPGIDFQSDGQYVVGPGSKTVDGEYQLINPAEPAPLPQSLIAALELYAERQEHGAEPTLLHSRQFKQECESAPPAIEGSNGDSTTYAMACRGKDLGLPADVTYELMRDYFNPRCQPPWADGKLYEKVKHAYKYSKNAAGSDTPEAKFSPDMARPTAHVETTAKSDTGTKEASRVVEIAAYKDKCAEAGIKPSLLKLDKHGTPLNTVANVACMLGHDPAWRGRIKYNEFSSNLEFSDRPPWRENQLNQNVSMSKRDLACMQVWFSNKAGWEVAESKLVAGVHAAATSYHPVREYLDSLVWDGIPRLDKILIDTAGADDTPYIQAVGRCVLIGAVKRIYEPGCKQDYVMVLEGNQGTRKSMWIATLGAKWYSASQLVRGDKDTFQNLRGRWFVELPEINATFRKVDFAWLKGIISQNVDVYRASYEAMAGEFPRESIFLGTINPNADGTYLKDEENRRYWPVVTRHLDIERLVRDRDQYFAEAVHRYRQGEPAWLTDENVKAEARKQQAMRQEKNGLVEYLENWVMLKESFAPNEVYAALSLTAKDLSSGHHRTKVYEALQQLGFEYHKADLKSAGHWKRKELTWADLI